MQGKAKGREKGKEVVSCFCFLVIILLQTIE
jgi:hypothetical protein